MIPDYYHIDMKFCLVKAVSTQKNCDNIAELNKNFKYEKSRQDCEASQVDVTPMRILNRVTHTFTMFWSIKVIGDLFITDEQNT